MRSILRSRIIILGNITYSLGTSRVLGFLLLGYNVFAVEFSLFICFVSVFEVPGIRAANDYTLNLLSRLFFPGPKTIDIGVSFLAIG